MQRQLTLWQQLREKNSCTKTNMMVETNTYPTSTSDKLKPGTCIKGNS